MEYINGVPILPEDFDINSALKDVDPVAILNNVETLSPGLSKLAHESALIGTDAIMAMLKMSGIGGNEDGRALITVFVEGSIHATLGTLIAMMQKESHEDKT